MNCIFCKIIKGEIPASKVYEDDDILAFMDIAPANKGHVLITPKQHHALFHEIPPNLLQPLIEAIQKIAISIVKTTNAEGYNILNNNNEVSGQVVPHAHFHIIPRHKDDGVDFGWSHKKYDEGEMEQLREKIAKGM